MNFYTKCHEIYMHFMDDESKRLFENRILYSLTEDAIFLQRIIGGLSEGKTFIENMNTCSPKYLFGAGAWGKELAQVFDGWEGFIDNNKVIQNSVIGNLNVYSTLEVPKNAKIFVSTRLHYKEIVMQLLKAGFLEENIINVGKVLDELAKKQYFDLSFLPHDKEETFLDVGSFDGMTSVRFAKWAEIFSNIYCFEADPKNIEKCKVNLKEYGGKCKIIEKAAWSCVTKIGFEGVGTGSSRMDIYNSNLVSTTTIDDELGSKKVTFIKMDIEGAEIEALRGAEKTITQHKPKLALSVYHKREDIVNIPRLILQYNPEYKLYLRHYSLTGSETVLYAI